MKKTRHFEYPEELIPKYKKAKKLEWLSIAYLISTAALMYMVMGNSQTMKTAWIEDVLGLTPALSFLIATRFVTKEPNDQFPFGYRRGSSIAYLVSAVALFTVGSYLLIDSFISLVKQEHATIGIVELFGRPVWLGYLMMLALVYATIPAIFLGRMKLPLAEHLHEKNLYADAKMFKANWMTGVASIVGIAGIGMGWWWADAAAAIFISVDIIHDGYTNLREAVFDLMDQAPKTIDDQDLSPLTEQVLAILNIQDWVAQAEVRLREGGHVIFGEGFVIPKYTENLITNVAKAVEEVHGLNWKMLDFHISVVDELPEK